MRVTCRRPKRELCKGCGGSEKEKRKGKRKEKKKKKKEKKKKKKRGSCVKAVKNKKRLHKGLL